MQRIFSALVLLTLMANPFTTLAAESATFRVGVTVNSSTTSATTTPTTTEETGGTTGGNGGPSQNVPPKILNIRVTPDVHSALLAFETEPHAVSVVRFGTTIDYEMGTIAGSLFLKEHSFNLLGLAANTKYYYAISVTDGFGGTATAEGLSFRTNNEGEIIVEPGIPTNPTQFTATAKTDHIQLQWKVPGLPNADVRIMRSETFYPNDPEDGTLVYQGKASATNDRNVEAGKTYYYTLFVKQGNVYSSGVIAKATMPVVGREPLPPSTNPFEGIATSTIVDPKIGALRIEDFLFVQDGRILNSDSGQVIIDGGKNLSVILPYERVPEILKTIGITLTDPYDPKKTFSFLLRINNDKTAYVATIAPLGRSGIYNLTVTVLDYKNQGLKILKGALLAQAQNGVPFIQGTLRRTTTILNCPPLYLSFVLFLILSAALPRKRREESGLLTAR